MQCRGHGVIYCTYELNMQSSRDQLIEFSYHFFSFFFKKKVFETRNGEDTRR